MEPDRNYLKELVEGKKADWCRILGGVEARAYTKCKICAKL
jgi:hypothetical protein